MRLYRTASGGWVGTQAEAKAGGRGWELVDVPMLKESLLVWLNINARPAPVEDEPANMTDEEVRQSNTPEAQREAAVRMAPTESQARASWTSTEIEDFILNQADVNQVANIFAKLGTRFAEIVREKTPLTGLLD